MEIESDDFVYVNTEKIEQAFRNTNFGNRSPSDILKYAVLKSVCGYKNGSTAQAIITELELVTKKGAVTKRGRQFLWESFGKKGM